MLRDWPAREGGYDPVWDELRSLTSAVVGVEKRREPNTILYTSFTERRPNIYTPGVSGYQQYQVAPVGWPLSQSQESLPIRGALGAS